MQSVLVTFGILEGRPSTPRLSPRTIREFDAEPLELLVGLVDVVDLHDDTVAPAGLSRLPTRFALRQGKRGLRTFGCHGHPPHVVAHVDVLRLFPAEFLDIKIDCPIDIVDEECHYRDIHVREFLSALTRVARNSTDVSEHLSPALPSVLHAARSGRTLQEDPAYHHDPCEADDGQNEPGIGTVRCPESVSRPRRAAQQA